MKNILTENKLVKNLRAYPVLHKRWCDYVKGVRELPEGFTAEKLFHDYLKVRRSNPEKRVSMSEYMIFGFYGLTTAQQKQYLTDVEATLLMRPYNSAAEPYLKSKVTFLKNFTQFVSRGWLYLPESDLAAFDAFVRRYHSIALKPQYSSWGIGFRKLTEAEWNAAPDRQALFDELCAGKYLAEEFIQSDASLARFHPESLNTLRVITFRRGERFEVFGAGLRVGNNGLHVDNAHGGGIFCEIDPATGVIMTDGLDEHGNSYILHPMTGVRFRGTPIPQWEEICDFCRSAAQTLPCLRVVGWDVAILPGGKLELIEGNHNPGMNIVQATGVIMTDGLDEHGNSYILHPMTGVRFRGTPIPQWEEICDFCRSAAQTLPCLRVVGWDVAILPGGKLELIEGNHNPGMNIVQAPAKHGVHDKFAHMLLDFYGDPAQYAYETVKQP